MPDPDVTPTGEDAGRVSEPGPAPAPAIEDGQGGLVSSPLILSLVSRLNNLEGSGAANRQSVLALGNEVALQKTAMTAAANLVEEWFLSHLSAEWLSGSDELDIVKAAIENLRR